MLLLPGVITSGTTAAAPTQHPSLRACITGVLGWCIRGMYYWVLHTDVITRCCYYRCYYCVLLLRYLPGDVTTGVLLGAVLLGCIYHSSTRGCIYGCYYCRVLLHHGMLSPTQHHHTRYYYMMYYPVMYRADVLLRDVTTGITTPWYYYTPHPQDVY